MDKPKVAIHRYQRPYDSVAKTISSCGGLSGIGAKTKVFIKPNIVFWTKSVPFPKFGVITTSRVVSDVVKILAEHGVTDITIGEGTVLYDPKDIETAAHAFETLGYSALAKTYGVKIVNVFQRPFQKVDLGDDVSLNFNVDYIESDYLVNLPVLKTHAQTVVSLGIKNVKGLIDINSRKKCHSADPEKDLHFMVSKLAGTIPPSLTLIDGIFTNERGPAFDGKIRRSDILVASKDVIAADKVGAAILGYQASEVPHLVHAIKASNRTLDLSEVDLVGEQLESVAMKLQHSFAYNEAGTLPAPMEKMGIKGLSYPKYDLSLCTYCSILTGVVLTSIAFAWQGKPWDDVEVLTGKLMKPSSSGKKTILLGKCLYSANKDHPDIDKMLAVKTCPPAPKAVVKVLKEAGIDVNPAIFENLDKAPAFFMRRYEGKPEFDESLFQIGSDQ